MTTTTVWRLSLQAWLALLALGLVLWAGISQFSLILEVMFILFGALLLGLVVEPVIQRLSIWRLPRGLATLLTYAAVAGVLIAIGGLVLPVLVAELTHLQANGPELLHNVVARLQNTPLLQRFVPAPETVIQGLVQRLDQVVRPLLSALAGVGGALLDLLFVFVLAYFLSADGASFRHLLKEWAPARYRGRIEAALGEVHALLARWIWSQLAIALYFALTIGAGLALLHVPFALSIGLIGGLLEIVPYLGTALAFILALISALSVGPLMLLWVTILFVVVVEVKANAIEPAFYSRIIGLHPAVVVVALVVGGRALGVAGVLFAIPTTVVLLTLAHAIRQHLREGADGLPSSHNEEKTEAVAVARTPSAGEGKHMEG